MAAIGVILIGTLALIALVLALLLLTAVDIRLRAATGATPPFSATVSFLGGWTPVIPIRGGRERPAGREHPRKKRPRKQAGARNARMVRAAPRLLADVLRAIRIDRLEVDADVGLGDPADTGQLFGALAPFVYGTAATPRLNLGLRPDFGAARLDGRVHARLRVVPGRLLAPLARFGWRAFGPGR